MNNLTFVITFILFVFGIIFGSFLNVLIDRLSTGRNFLKGRSYCEHCKKELKPYDLIPLVSYVLLKGKCRYCKAKIPFRLFFIELLSGIVFTSLYFNVLNSNLQFSTATFLAVILLSFIGIFFADIVYGIIPDTLVIISFISSLLYLLSIHSNIISNLLSAVGAILFFLFLFIITKGRGMGFGDVKLSFVLGFLLGFPLIVVALYLAFLTGATISIILVIWKKLKFSGGTIPFGPFLVVSAIVALFLGEKIILPLVSHLL